MESYLLKTNSFRRVEDSERYGELTLKLGDYGIKFYQIPERKADILRQSLLDSEKNILEQGESTYNYPEDQITGKMTYYNLFVDVEEWYRIGYPYVKEFVADYLDLKYGEVMKIKSWGNILRLDNKIYPHRHFGTPDNYKDFPQSVSGNIFLGAETETATTYILGTEKVDVPNNYGQVTLFPPDISHAVRSYKGKGTRISAAFDCFCVTRDPNASVSGTIWSSWTHE
tara:strand:+ start:3136 stop:3816 length:681 start_codon:yes stop_codon:yes gene_type:complete